MPPKAAPAPAPAAPAPPPPPPAAEPPAPPPAAATPSTSAPVDPHATRILHDNGSVFVQLDRHHIGNAYYPSGAIAVTVDRVAGGGPHTYIYREAGRRALLGGFTHEGVGSVQWRSGRPRLVTNKAGFTITDEQGNIVQSELWAKWEPKELVLEVTESMRLRMTDRQHMSLDVRLGGRSFTFNVGEHLAREGTYLDNLKGRGPGGRLVIDVEKVRAQRPPREAPPKPFRTAADFSAPLQPAVEGLLEFRRQAREGELLKADPFVRTQRKPASAPAAEPAPEALPAEPFEMTATKRPPWQKRLPKRYRSYRKKLTPLRADGFDKRVAEECGSGGVVVVVALADWNPESRRAESWLEEVNGMVQLPGEELVALQKSAAEAQAARTATAGRRAASPPEGSAKAGRGPLGAETMLVPPDRFKLFKFDVCESGLLSERHNFKALPMFLFYAAGRLVDISTLERGVKAGLYDLCQLTAMEQHCKRHLYDKVREAALKGAQGAFLPQDYKLMQGSGYTMAVAVKG
eukprot:tig00021579_g22434.t1